MLKAIERSGVEFILSSPGSEWPPVWEALAEAAARGAQQPKYINCRHEAVAVAMAAGYTKVTHRPQVVMLHATAGPLNAAMTLRAALHERVPMVLLAGESISFGERPGYGIGPQWLRLLTDTGGPARLAAPCVKWSFGLNDGALLAATIERACRIATSAPRGPAFVSIPTEYLMDSRPTEAQRSAAPVRNAWNHV